MISMYDYKMVDTDFNFENTLNENKALKSNNRALGIILAVVLISVVCILITDIVAKRSKEETNQ
ncbi:MAG: hypothetical protein RLZZ577_1052 [Bacteroidota bacterium]|jgi:hypothetical protein